MNTPYDDINSCCHCFPVWGKANSIIKMQNKAVRLFAGVITRINTDPLYFALSIVPLKSLDIYAIGLVMYQYSNDVLAG